MNPTSGIYWVDLSFINNYKEPQLWLVLLRYNADVANAFPWVVTVYLVMWCMQRERVVAFNFGMTLRAVLVLWKSYIWNYLSMLWLKKHWFFIWFFMLQIKVVRVETYFSVVHLMTRKWGDFTLFLSMFLLEYQGGRVMMFWFSSWIVVVFLMCASFIILY